MKPLIWETTTMAKFKCKGEDLKPFVKSLSLLGKDVRDLRLECSGGVLTGSAVPDAHNAVIIAKMSLDGLDMDDMDGLVTGVDMRNFRTLTDLAGPDEELEVVMDLGRFNMKIGRHIQRSFPLLGQVPGALDPKAPLPFAWRMPSEAIRPLVKALDLDDKYAKLRIEMMDTGLIMLTESYGGSNRASYTIASDAMAIVEGAEQRFKVMYPFDDFVTLKDLPVDGELVFRCGKDLPLEVVGGTGRLSVRAMYAPMVEND